MEVIKKLCLKIYNNFYHGVNNFLQRIIKTMKNVKKNVRKKNWIIQNYDFFNVLFQSLIYLKKKIIKKEENLLNQFCYERKKNILDDFKRNCEPFSLIIDRQIFWHPKWDYYESLMMR